MTKGRKNKRNITVWMEKDVIATLDKCAKEAKRSRNYYLERLLGGFSRLSKGDKNTILSKLDCKELCPWL